MSKWYITFALASLPGFWVIAAWFSGLQSQQALSSKARRITFWGTLMLSSVLFTVLILLATGILSVQGPLPFKVHPLNTLIVALVVFIGMVLMRYSRNYMQGEQCYPQFFRWMTYCQAAVVVTLLANHMLIFWLGWLCISLSLHRLLTLYPERPRALLAAHKKFILARTSEALILVAFMLLYHVYGTFYIDELLTAISSDSILSSQSHTLASTAAVLLAVAALLKCAQLPFHGWLISVVETPTPVSALLHAGIINLGGYLMLLFAPLVSSHSAAQWVLLVGAGMSMFFASLIVMTRISVKVRLAWSTSAQMGLMLIECALGLYELALLHLIAHSLYKAYAFLNSGNAVYENLDMHIAGLQRPKGADWVNALFIATLTLASCLWLTQWQGPISPWVLLGSGLTLLLTTRTQNTDQAQMYMLIAATLVLAFSYTTLKGTLGDMVTTGMPAAVAPFSMMDNWMSGVFALLFFLQIALLYLPERSWVQRLNHRLFAGLYLDEWFTRTTLWLWPARPLAPANRSSESTSVTQIRR